MQSPEVDTSGTASSCAPLMEAGTSGRAPPRDGHGQPSRASRKKRKRAQSKESHDTIEPRVGDMVEAVAADFSVWPARILGFASNAHLRLQFLEWEDLAPIDEVGVYLRSTCAPISEKPGQPHEVVKGDNGVVVLCIDDGANGDVMRHVVVTRVLSDGIAVRIRPRKQSTRELLFSKEEMTTIRWCSKFRFSPYGAAPASRLAFTPRASQFDESQVVRPVYTARQLLEWRKDPTSVTSQLSAPTTPTDFV